MFDLDDLTEFVHTIDSFHPSNPLSAHVGQVSAISPVTGCADRPLLAKMAYGFTTCTIVFRSEIGRNQRTTHPHPPPQNNNNNNKNDSQEVAMRVSFNFFTFGLQTLQRQLV